MHAIGGGGGAQRCAERRSVAVEGAGEVTPRAAVWCRCTPTSDYCVGYNVQDVCWVPASFCCAAVPNTSHKAHNLRIRPSTPRVPAYRAAPAYCNLHRTFSCVDSLRD